MSAPGLGVQGVTVAIDVDGALCPFVDPLDPLHHERETGWTYTVLPGANRESVVGNPILQTLFDLGGVVRGGGSSASMSGTRVLWHTSWWLKASEVLAPALGLSALAGGAEKQFATEAERYGRDSSVSPSKWWKLAAVERWLLEHPIDEAGQHELLIWVDDDIDDAVASGEISAELIRDPRLVMISPSIHVGINPSELALLRSLTGLS